MSTLLTSDQRSQAVGLAWEMGRLTYKLRKTQRFIKEKWIESSKKYRKFYVESTRRLGKSTLLLSLFTEECLSSPHRKCGFFAPVKDGLLDYIEPLIAKTYDDCPEPLRPVFDRARFMLKFKNGSTIIFRGSNNQQHRVRRGQEFHRAGVDEARDVDRLQELVDSVIMPSLFSTDGHLLISSTPADTMSHPLFEIRERARAEGWYVKVDIEEAHAMDPDVYSRERIDEWKSETLKSLDGADIWDREYGCKWVVNRRRMAIPEWNTDAYSTRINFTPDPYYSFYHHYVGIDWGYKDFTACVLATRNWRKGRLEFDGELTFSGKDVRSDIISDRLNRESAHHWGKDNSIYRQVSDSADPILINELNKYKGMSFMPVQKAHTLEAMLNEFRILVSQGKIVVKPNCRMLIHCLETAVWTEKRDKLDQDVFAHHFDHLMAAVYLARMVDWEANPIPADYMVDNIRIVDINFDKTKAQGQSAKSLESAFARRR